MPSRTAVWALLGGSGVRQRKRQQNVKDLPGLVCQRLRENDYPGGVQDSTANPREGDVSLPSGEGPGREGQAGGTITVMTGRGPSQLLWSAMQRGEGSVEKQGLVPVLPAAAVTSSHI